MSRVVLILLVIAFVLIGITYMTYRFFRNQQEHEQKKELMKEEHRREREERDWDRLMDDIEDDDY